LGGDPWGRRKEGAGKRKEERDTEHAHNRRNHGQHNTNTTARTYTETTNKTVPKTKAKHMVAHGLGNEVLDLHKFQFIFGVDAGVICVS